MATLGRSVSWFVPVRGADLKKEGGGGIAALALARAAFGGLCLEVDITCCCGGAPDDCKMYRPHEAQKLKGLKENSSTSEQSRRQDMKR
jgi:hypothetical protein